MRSKAFRAPSIKALVKIPPSVNHQSARPPDLILIDAPLSSRLSRYTSLPKRPMPLREHRIFVAEIVATMRPPVMWVSTELVCKLPLYNSRLQNRMTILFEPDGIVVKEDVASTTIHGPNVERLLAALRADPPLKPWDSAISEAARLALWRGCGKF